MESEEEISHEEKDFQKTFSTMSEMVKFLYDDYLEWKRSILGVSFKVKNE
jgi:hypothetical protein